jgi:hypothetical protein
MTATTIRVQMAQRKDTAAGWTAANPILLSGEIGYETDTKKFKIGNGSTNWNSLTYLPIPDGSGNLTITGNLEIGTTGSLTFEGSTADGFETTLAVTNPTADRTITLPNVTGTVITTGDTGSVTSTMLADGTIVNADISATAEIAVSKLANGTVNQVIVTDGTNVSWSDNLTLAGDLTVNGTTTTINTQDLLVEDKNIIIGNVATPTDLTADGGGITLKGATDKTINWVDSTDAWTLSEHVNIASGKEYRIAGTKVLDATSLGSSVLITSANITDGTIVNGDISDSAEIAVSKLADGAARQLLQTDAAGTGVEWTDNIDVPGTLDVTGAATFDSSVAVTGALTKSGSNVVTVGDSGTVTSTMIADGTIVNADVNSSAAIAGTKISPDFGSQNVTTTGNATAAALIPSGSSVPTNGVYLPSANNVAISTNGTGRLFIDGSGRLGLGTSSPGAQLDVSGSAASAVVGAQVVNTDASGYSNLILRNSGGTAREYQLVVGGSTSASANNFWLYDATAGQVRLHVSSAGNVGIGTTSPADRLTVVDGTNIIVGAGALALNNYTNEGAGFTFGRANDGARVMALGVVDTDKLLFAGREGLLFAVGGAGLYSAVTEAARIDSSGRLLVGSSSSAGASRLQVLGDSSATTNPGKVRIGTGYTAAAFSGPTELGQVNFGPSDDVTAAQISAWYDVTGTGSTSDFPGRLIFSTTADGASSPTERMRIDNAGNIAIGIGAGTTYRVGITVASGADRDIFLAGISGASNGFQINWIHSTTALSVKFNDIATTASAANAFLDSADGNRIYRSTSSLRYKTNIEDIDQLRADAVLSLRPVWYRSKAADDRSDWSWYGLIAEEVAQIEPRIVHWTYLDEDYDVEEVNGTTKKTPKPDAELVPDGVQYDRLTVLLLDVVKRQNKRIEVLEAKVAALESQ